MPPSAGLAAESSTPLLPRKVLPLLLPGPGRPSDPNRDVARLRQRGHPVRPRHRRRRRPRPRRREALSARGALLRSTTTAGEASLLCEAGERPRRPLGSRLPAVDEEAHTRLASTPRGRRAARERLRRHRRELEGVGGEGDGDEVPGRVARGLAEAREPDPRVRLLPRLDAEPAGREDRRPARRTAATSTRDRSYLVSFVWQETNATGGSEVHVNFRGYPGRTKIPVCRESNYTAGKQHYFTIPCFDDPRGHAEGRRRDRDRLHGQPGRRPVARPLRVAPQRLALHGLASTSRRRSRARRR